MSCLGLCELFGAGHPLLGDTVYRAPGSAAHGVAAAPGNCGEKSVFRSCCDLMKRPALHAASLGFVHPTTGVSMEFKAEMPTDFVSVVESIT